MTQSMFSFEVGMDTFDKVYTDLAWAQPFLTQIRSLDKGTDTYDDMEFVQS